MVFQEVFGRCADLHSCSSIGELAQLCLDLIARASHCDAAIFAVTDNERGRCAGAFWPDDCNLPDHMPAYEAHWHENPIGQRHLLLSDDQTTRLDDAIDRPALEKLGYYNEYLRPARLGDVMTGYMGRRGRYRLALTACRGDGSFTVEERDAMERIRRHAVPAFWNFTRIANLSGCPLTVEDLLGSGLHTGMVIRDSVAQPARPSRIRPLTPAERNVLTWMIEGKTNPEIAIILGCAVRTVHKHVEHILQKLCVENRVTAVVRALALRLLD
jgi:DNA-binding CsgD family transcriptional regulator